MKTGRNDACPCGSGKKYKKCCLTADEAAQARHPIHARDEALVKRLAEWARRQLGGTWFTLAYEAIRGDMGDSEDDFFLPLLLHHYRGAAEPYGTVVEQFLATRPHLTPAEQELLDVHARARLSVFAVVEAVPGERMLLHDRLHGGEFWTHERTASHAELQTHLLGRLVEVDGQHRLLGNSIHGLPPHAAEHVLEWMQRRFAALTPEIVNGSEGSFALVRFWYDAVRGETHEHNQPGVIRDRFSFSADRETVLRALQDLPGVQLEPDGSGAWMVGGVAHADFEWSEAGDLVVHTDTEHRADAVQTLLADLALPGFRRAERAHAEVAVLVPSSEQRDLPAEPGVVLPFRRGR